MKREHVSWRELTKLQNAVPTGAAHLVPLFAKSRRVQNGADCLDEIKRRENMPNRREPLTINMT
jgi:hypothetical protein